MWIFHPKIARIRRDYDLVVRIEVHSEVEVAGKREGRVLADKSAPSHPIPTSQPASVMVRFVDGKQAVRIEEMEVGALMPTIRLKHKGTHVIFKGNKIGTIVNHTRTERGVARVFAEGSRRLEAFSIDKSKLCIVETPIVCEREGFDRQAFR